MTISIVISCRSCGTSYTPSSADIVRGVWRLCPPCREPPTERYLHHPDDDLEPPREDADHHREERP